jgi:hypothetical protein
VFCPNCGTENDDAATTCKKCGFNLKGAAAPKFKGTMLMMNAPAGLNRPPGAPGAPAAAPPPAAPPMGAPPQAAPPGAGSAGRPMLKGTMLGVAPPSMGAHGPPAGMAPAAPPHGAPPAPVGSPHGAGAPPAPAPMGPPPGGVNPLGGTIVADPAGVGFSPYGQGPGAYGAPPQGSPPGGPQGGFGPPPGFGQPPAQGGFGAPDHHAGGGFPPPGGHGQPPAGQGGFGAPPAQGGYGQPQGGYGQPQGGYGEPHGGYGQPPGGYGQPPGQQHGHAPPAAQPQGYGQPGPGGYGGPPAPYGAPGGAMVAAPAGGRGPIGTTRNPVMVLVIGMLCFVYAFIQIWQMVNELKAFRGKDDINPIFFFIPILNIIQIWNLPPKILEAKQMAGVPNPEVVHPVLYLFLSPYFLAVDLNEIWQAAGGGQPR